MRISPTMTPQYRNNSLKAYGIHPPSNLKYKPFLPTQSLKSKIKNSFHLPTRNCSWWTPWLRILVPTWFKVSNKMSSNKAINSLPPISTSFNKLIKLKPISKK